MNPNREEALFALALEKPAEKRATFLDVVCEGDPALRARLDALLAAHEASSGVLGNKPVQEVPAPTLDLHEPAPDEAVGQTVGRYKLLERVGEGGCGVVYVAEQIEPVRRRVALKVIKLGMDTKQVVARFEAERQALAMMDHPNIAKVLDAGTTEAPVAAGILPAVEPGFQPGGEGVPISNAPEGSRPGPGGKMPPSTAGRMPAATVSAGRPYFVMELVRGIKITDYCDQANLSTRERLDLFIKVCQAIQHAHQKGIIHRDIKPGNILVTLHDGVPVPKVIDFGIAKATEGRLTDSTVYTQLHQFMGTPAYMSPEQAEMSGLDVDTRSDIYSLGVLLYQLLTSKTPFDGKELLSMGIDAMRKTIREKEPMRPSTRLASLQGEELTTTAKRRSADAPRLIHLLKGDLDWIVMKALEKDRTRRYETANGLAMDIQRHLTNEPIVARPPSTAYRLQKAWQRNKLACTAGAAVALALVVSLGASTWQAAEANLARKRETSARQEETKARAQAEWNERAAVSNASVAVVQRQRAETAVQRMLIQSAEKDLTDGETARGVALLAHVLDQNPSNHVAAQRLSSALLHRSFVVPAFIMTGGGRLCEFSRDGRWIVSGSRDGSARVWDAHRGQPVGEPMLHTQRIRVVRISPDGTRVITGSDDNTARLWDARTGQPVGEPLAHQGPVYSADFSPDGKQVATGSFDGSVHFWNPRDGRELGDPIQTKSPIWCVRFSPDGSRLATGAEDAAARLWDVNTRTQTGPLMRHRSTVPSVRFSPDGRFLATASHDNTARIWSVETGEAASPLLVHGFVMNSAEFSPDGQRLVTAANDGQACIWNVVWNVATGRRVGQPLKHQGRVEYARFSPDGLWVITAGQDDAARLWDASTGKPVSELMRHGGRVFSADFSPDGAFVVTGSEDGTVRVWPVRPGSGTGLKLAQRGARQVCFSPDSRRVASAGAENTVQVWDVRSGAPIGPVLPHAGLINDLRFSSNGRWLLTASSDHTARVWDADTGQPLSPPLQHEALLYSAAFSPDGQRVATASSDGTARVWDARTGEPIGEACRHAGWIMSVEFSPDGSRLITAAEDRTAQMWDAATGQALGKPFRHRLRVYAARFSRDGNRVVTGSEDQTAQVWDAQAGEPIGEPMKHSAGIRSVSFSPDSRRVLTGSEDGKVRVWDAQTGRAISPPMPQGGWTSAQFSPDGKQVLAWAESLGWAAGTGVRLWDAQTGQALSELFPGGNDAEFSPDGRWIVTANYAGAWVYEIPQVPAPAPAWLPRLAEAVAGQRLVPGQEILEPVAPDDWMNLENEVLKDASRIERLGWVRSLLPSASRIPNQRKKAGDHSGSGRTEKPSGSRINPGQ